MAEFVWINQQLLSEQAEGKTLDEMGIEWREAMRAAAEGRVADYPDWMADSIDGVESVDEGGVWQ